MKSIDWIWTSKGVKRTLSTALLVAISVGTAINPAAAWIPIAIKYGGILGLAGLLNPVVKKLNTPAE